MGKEGDLLARDRGIHRPCKAQRWGRGSVRGRETPDSGPRTLQTGDCQPSASLLEPAVRELTDRPPRPCPLSPSAEPPPWALTSRGTT